jgi:hypothetical protein
MMSHWNGVWEFRVTDGNQRFSLSIGAHNVIHQQNVNIIIFAVKRKGARRINGNLSWGEVFEEITRPAYKLYLSVFHS